EHGHGRLFSPPTAPARRVPRGVALLAPRGPAQGHLVFAVQILGDPFGPPAARITRRKRFRLEAAPDRQRECFAPPRPRRRARAPVPRPACRPPPASRQPPCRLPGSPRPLSEGSV